MSACLCCCVCVCVGACRSACLCQSVSAMPLPVSFSKRLGLAQSFLVSLSQGQRASAQCSWTSEPWHKNGLYLRRAQNLEKSQTRGSSSAFGHFCFCRALVFGTLESTSVGRGRCGSGGCGTQRENVFHHSCASVNDRGLLRTPTTATGRTRQLLKADVRFCGVLFTERFVCFCTLPDTVWDQGESLFSFTCSGNPEHLKKEPLTDHTILTKGRWVIASEEVSSFLFCLS